MIRLSIFTFLAALAALRAPQAYGQSYNLTWSTLGAGGVMWSTGGGYQLGATVGQPYADAAPMTGGGYTMSGGFWNSGIAAPVICRGDADCNGSVGFTDIDYFVESIPDNEAAWVALYQARHGGAAPPCTFANCDVDGDTHVGFMDIDPFVNLIPSACP